MTIAIDASRAVSEKPTGTELYSARVIQYLAKIDTENTYWLYSPVEPPKSFGKLPDNFIWKIIPMKRLWSQIRFALALWQDKPDLVFIPAHVLPLYLPKKRVVTVHDLAYEVFPEAYGTFARWYLRYGSRRAVQMATRVITPSLATKKDILKIYGGDDARIVPTLLGVDKERFTKKIPATKEIKELGEYFVSVGRLEVRKNTARVIRAYQQFRQQNPDQTAKLVLIGKPGFGYEAVEATLAAVPKDIARDIIRPGYLDDETMTSYVQHAIGYVSPALYEGFGISVLEAMVAGAPVITSDISSLPEVVGDAAILVNPESVDEIAGAMKILATNDLSRGELAKRAKEQAEHFSWDKMSRQTLDVLKQAAEGE